MNRYTIALAALFLFACPGSEEVTVPAPSVQVSGGAEHSQSCGSGGNGGTSSSGGANSGGHETVTSAEVSVSVVATVGAGGTDGPGGAGGQGFGGSLVGGFGGIDTSLGGKCQTGGGNQSDDDDN